MKRFLFPLKFNHPEADVFFWGCTHIGHDPKWDVPLWAMRGFQSSEEHDAHIYAALKSRLKPTSILFLLGDTAFGRDARAKIETLFAEVPFAECYIMPGNHTAGWKQLFAETDSEGALHINDKKVVYFVPNYLEMFINGHSIACSHYPILSWNGQGHKSIMLFSHVHGSLENSEVGRLYVAKGHCKEVSVEKAKYPLSFNEIKTELNNKSSETFDHHGEHTQNPF